MRGTARYVRVSDTEIEEMCPYKGSLCIVFANTLTVAIGFQPTAVKGVCRLLV